MSLLSASAKITSVTGSTGFYDYPIGDSLRFDGSSYLSRMFGSGNQKTWTWSGWVKRGNFGTSQALFSDNETYSFCQISFNSSDKITFNLGYNPANPIVDTVAVFRDVSAWYHIVCVVDTTNVTGNDRARMYVNGVRQEITAISEFPPTLNYEPGINRAVNHSIGRNTVYSQYFNGYLANIQFIDGQALDASYFGETKDDIWVPKAYTGSYGTNGFHLDFADSSNIGNDVSGNNNDWTVN